MPDLESPEIQRDADRAIPTTRWGSHVKAGRIVQEHQVAGDTSKHAGRLGLVAQGEFWLKQGAMSPSSRLSPMDFAQFKERVSGREPTEEQVAGLLPESWTLFTEESRILGAIAKRSQAIIEERVAQAKPTVDLVAVEVRMGKAYAVRRGEDNELDQLLFELDGVTRRKGDFLEVPR